MILVLQKETFHILKIRRISTRGCTKGKNSSIAREIYNEIGRIIVRSCMKDRLCSISRGIGKLYLRGNIGKVEKKF